VLVRLFAVLAWLACSLSVAAAGELRRETVASPHLGRDFSYLIYLPDGYQPGTTYPVVYLLHGAGSDEQAWSQQGQIQQNLDSLVASRAIPPVVVVMPGCVGCWWVDGARDKAETAFWQDFVPAVERRYDLAVTRAGRFVAGLSAGGYGAIRFALRYPDRLAGAAAFSPAVYTETVPSFSAARSQPPFLDANGQFDQKAWDAQNYPQWLPSYFAQGHRLPVYLVSGDNDRFGIAPETMKLFMALFARQPDQTELRIIDGDHNWDVWASALRDSLVFLLKNAPPPQVATPRNSVVLAGRGPQRP